MKTKVFYPCKTTDTIIVLYILVCVFLNSKHEDKFSYIFIT
jgi:hypothetical protein